MTTSFVTVVHCDFPGCGRRDEQPDDKTMPAGWTGAVYTHGCRDHGDAILQHRADVTCDTRRGKDYWYLTCACGWTPQSRWQMWSSDGLKKQHLRHLGATVATTNPEEIR